MEFLEKHRELAGWQHGEEGPETIFEEDDDGDEGDSLQLNSRPTTPYSSEKPLDQRDGSASLPGSYDEDAFPALTNWQPRDTAVPGETAHGVAKDGRSEVLVLPPDAAGEAPTWQDMSSAATGVGQWQAHQEPESAERGTVSLASVAERIAETPGGSALENESLSSATAGLPSSHTTVQEGDGLVGRATASPYPIDGASQPLPTTGLEIDGSGGARDVSIRHVVDVQAAGLLPNGSVGDHDDSDDASDSGNDSQQVRQDVQSNRLGPLRGDGDGRPEEREFMEAREACAEDATRHQ